MSDTSVPATGIPLESGAPATSTGSGAGEPVRITWHGSPWSLAGLGLLNMLLTIVTLGFYQFWGKTEVRRRIWQSVRINGEPLEYVGTGRELFLGFIIVFFLVLLPMIGLFTFTQIYFGPEHPAFFILFMAVYVLIFFLVGIAVYRARRYRLSRTRFRGIRGALVGSSLGFGWSAFWSLLLIPFTWGWIVPWRANFLHRTITNDMRFGDKAFLYKGQAGPLYPPYVLAWVGGILVYVLAVALFMFAFWDKFEAISKAQEAGVAPPELQFSTGENVIIFAIVVSCLLLYSLFYGWYQARMLNQFTSRTTLGTLSFRLDVTALGLVWLFISNYLLTLASLTILRPVAEARTFKFLIERLVTEGTLDFATIGQSTHRLSRTGEGLAEAFDIDALG
ncbi:MAG: YjgN family protein [Hyphomicrobiaceae bacterium]